MFDNNLKKLAKYLNDNNLFVSTAESCTGGLLSSRFTDISGSSNFIRLNFVTYANDAKEEMLQVPSEIIADYGVVSEKCAFYMAKGLQEKTGCDVAICTTGIAGPTGGSKEKPVGLMYASVFFNGNIVVKKVLLPHFIPRKLMKFLFTQNAINFAYNVICQNADWEWFYRYWKVLMLSFVKSW